MLVLSRKPEEKILIGKEIVITILKIHGDKVSVGIQAHPDTPIFREELMLASKGNKLEKLPKKTRRADMPEQEESSNNNLKCLVEAARCSTDKAEEAVEQHLEKYSSYHH
jgi:carbon storage regulator